MARATAPYFSNPIRDRYLLPWRPAHAPLRETDTIQECRSSRRGRGETGNIGRGGNNSIGVSVTIRNQSGLKFSSHYDPTLAGRPSRHQGARTSGRHSLAAPNLDARGQ